MTLSANELSAWIGVAPATIERWARQGRLPAACRGETLRFRIQDVEQWAGRQQIRLNLPGQPAPPSEKPGPPQLSQAVACSNMIQDVRGHDKPDVIQACIRQMDGIPRDFKEDLWERIMAREAAMSTGIGQGIAIPHPRDPLGYLPRSMVVPCFLRTPVDYGAIDQVPVRILFFLLSRSLDDHLPLLSALSGMLRQDVFLAFLGRCTDSRELAEQIRAFESDAQGGHPVP